MGTRGLPGLRVGPGVAPTEERNGRATGIAVRASGAQSVPARAATGIAHLLEDLDGGQLTEAAEGGQAVDDGGYGVGAYLDQLRAGVVGLVGLAVELLDECFDAGGHDAEWSRRQKVGSHQQSTKRSSGHGARSSADQSSKESRARSMGRHAGSRGSSSAGGRRADVPSAMCVAGAEVLVVPLGLDQGDLVRAAAHGGPAELDPVVLPEADGAADPAGVPGISPPRSPRPVRRTPVNGRRKPECSAAGQDQTAGHSRSMCSGNVSRIDASPISRTCGIKRPPFGSFSFSRVWTADPSYAVQLFCGGDGAAAARPGAPTAGPSPGTSRWAGSAPSRFRGRGRSGR